MYQYRTRRYEIHCGTGPLGNKDDSGNSTATNQIHQQSIPPKGKGNHS